MSYYVVVIDVGGDDSEALESKPLGVEGARELLVDVIISFHFLPQEPQNVHNMLQLALSCQSCGSNLFFSSLSLSISLHSLVTHSLAGSTNQHG